jgi:hypothetical protein
MCCIFSVVVKPREEIILSDRMYTSFIASASVFGKESSAVLQFCGSAVEKVKSE